MRAKQLFTLLARGRMLPAWLAKNPAVVGQSFGAEQLGFSLTSRLATPLDLPSHHTRPGALSSFWLRVAVSGNVILLQTQGEKKKTEAQAGYDETANPGGSPGAR